MFSARTKSTKATDGLFASTAKIIQTKGNLGSIEFSLKLYNKWTQMFVLLYCRYYKKCAELEGRVRVLYVQHPEFYFLCVDGYHTKTKRITPEIASTIVSPDDIERGLYAKKLRPEEEKMKEKKKAEQKQKEEDKKDEKKKAEQKQKEEEEQEKKKKEEQRLKDDEEMNKKKKEQQRLKEEQEMNKKKEEQRLKEEEDKKNELNKEANKGDEDKNGALSGLSGSGEDEIV